MVSGEMQGEKQEASGRRQDVMSCCGGAFQGVKEVRLLGNLSQVSIWVVHKG